MKKLSNNDQKVLAATKLLEMAKTLGFSNAFLAFEDENEDFYERFDAIAENYDKGETVEVKIHLTLDEDIEVEGTQGDDLNEDEE